MLTAVFLTRRLPDESTLYAKHIADSWKALFQTKGDSDVGGEETTATIKGSRRTGKNRSIKYVCPE